MTLYTTHRRLHRIVIALLVLNLLAAGAYWWRSGVYWPVYWHGFLALACGAALLWGGAVRRRYLQSIESVQRSDSRRFNSWRNGQ
jgi:hypothetical protein